MLLSEKMFYVLIAAVVFACGVGGNEFYHTFDDKPQPIDCQDLEKKLGYANAAQEFCVRELVQEQMKTDYLKGIDTSGVSCSDIVRHLHEKYTGDRHYNETVNAILQMKLDTLGKAYTQCMHQLADSTINYMPKGVTK